MRQLLPGWIELKPLPFPMSLPGVARTPGKRCGLNLLLLSSPHRVFFWTLASIVKVKWEFFLFLFRSFDAKTFQTEVTFFCLPGDCPSRRRISFSSCFLYFFYFVDISWFLLGVKLGSKLRWGVDGWGWEKSTFRKARLVVVLSNQFLFHSLPFCSLFLVLTEILQRK